MLLPKKNFIKHHNGQKDDDDLQDGVIVPNENDDNEMDGGDSTRKEEAERYKDDVKQEGEIDKDDVDNTTIGADNGDNTVKVNSKDRIASSATTTFEDDERKNAQHFKTHADADDNEKGVLTLIKTSEYILLLIWFSIQLIPLQYYIAIIGFQLERMGDNAGTYTSVFSIIYASAAVLAPLLGKIADTAGLGIAQALATVLTSSSVLILSAEETLSLNQHLGGMICYGVGRMIVFGLFFTNVGKRFGYTHFGTLAGLGLIVSAIFSLFQYPLISLSAAGHERIGNLTCGVVLLIQGLPYCFWLRRRENCID